MKKALLWILSIVTILSAICMPVVADDYEGHEAIGGETVTVVFKIPDEMEYTNIKSGALEYSFDDTLDLEYVKGSAKWLIPNLFIKDVDETKQNAIFAFASAQTVGGAVFSMKFKVNENPSKGTNYKIDATLNLNQGEHIIFLYDVIFIVEENDDPTTPADFAAVVNTIDTTVANEKTYTAIVDALEKYNALTKAEKEAAAGDYAKLLSQIEAYNAGCEVINTESQSILKIAFSAVSGVFEYLARLLKIIIQIIWG